MGDKLTRGTKIRIFVVLFVLVGFMSVYVASFLFYWAVIEHGSMLAKAENQQQREITVLADRGNIYDRNGKVLAQNTPAWDIIISPQEIYRISIYFTHGNVFMSNFISQFIPPSSSPSPWVHTSVLHICITIAALELGSSVPLF